MVEVYNKALDETTEIDRIIGRYRGEKPGPTLIFMAGTHGNETSSIFALKKIFDDLEEQQPDFKGEIVAAYAGNLKALKHHVRYIDKDLNRIWIPESLQQLGFDHEKNHPEGNEKEEQEQLIELLDDTIKQADDKVYVFDLHTTSSVSPPFLGIGDTIKNRELALQYPLPCVVGFDEETTGTFMNYMNEQGYTCVALEAGEHFSMEAIENHESFVWYSLKLTGCMDKRDIPEFKIHHNRLAKSTLDAQKLFELKYMYTIKPDEEFKMKPGYTTFDKIKKGEVLAENREGVIRAPMSGRIFMPLYQEQGDDGFFIVEEVSHFWLDLSAFLRRFHLERILMYLPGIDMHPDSKRTLVIRKNYVTESFLKFLHMIGYRRKRFEDNYMIITRRQFDLKSPFSE